MLYPLSYGRMITAWATSKSIPAAGTGCEIGGAMNSVTALRTRRARYVEGPRPADRGPSEAQTLVRGWNQRAWGRVRSALQRGEAPTLED